MEPDLRRLIIFEADSRGHAREWLRHILAAAERQGVRNRITLLIARDLAEALSAPLTGGADIVPLSQSEERLCNTGSAFQRGLAKWMIVRRHVKRLSADSVFFLGIDHILAPLALGRGMPGEIPVSGILFRPTAHYGAFANAKPGTKERLKQRIKWNFLLRALHNPALSTLLSLDPYFPPYAHQDLPGGGKVVRIDDPAPVQLGPVTDTPQVTRSGKTALLLFGEITERKGALQLIEALKRIPSKRLRDMEVTIAGRIEPLIEKPFYQALRELEWGRPETHVRVEDRWISDTELASLLTKTDIVLAPYQRFVGSSGVLIRAAQYRKPVICQDFGLLGQFVRDFGLGLATDTCDPAKLAQALELAVSDRLLGAAGAARFQDFLKGRDPDHFGDQVLETAFSPWAGSMPDRPSGNSVAMSEKMVTGVPRLVTRSVVRLVK